MPPPVGRILLSGNHHVAGALLPELRLSRPQELDQVPGQEDQLWMIKRHGSKLGMKIIPTSPHPRTMPCFLQYLKHWPPPPAPPPEGWLVIPRHELNVGCVDESKTELHGPLLDRHVGILETIEDGGAVALHRGMVHAHRPQQCVQRHVADVFVIIQQEATKDVHSQDSAKDVFFAIVP